MKLRKRKVTLKLIENVTDRKARYKIRVKGLMKKMEELTTLCDIEACAVVFGPGDTCPRMWPSPEVATQLLERFEEIPEVERHRNVVDQLSYMTEMTQKNEEKLMKLKKRNEEREMSLLMYQILHDGKPLSEIEPSLLMRLLSHVDEEQKNLQKKMSESEEELPPPIDDPIPNNPPSPTPLNDLVNQADETNNIVLDDNIITSSSNIMVPPIQNPDDFDMVLPPQESHDIGQLFVQDSLGHDSDNSQLFPIHESFEGFDNEVGLDNNIMVPPVENPSDVYLVSPQERHDIGELFLANNIGNESDYSELFPIHGDFNIGEVGDNDVLPSFGSAIGEGDTTLLEGNNNIGTNNTNQRENTDHINEADMGTLELDTNFNFQLPSRGYFGNSSEGPVPFAGKFPGSDC